MTMTAKFILVVALVLSIAIPFGAYLLSEKKKGNFKASVIANSFFFFGTLLIAHVLLFTGTASAADGNTVASVDGWRYLAAALSTGLSCIGGGIAVASAASAALGAMSEDSSIMGKALIFVALAEGIALYGLIVSFSILG